MLKWKLLVKAIVCVPMFWACTNMAPELATDDPVSGDCVPEFPDMNITYENYVKGVLTRNCITCHYPGNSPGPGDFTTYEGIQVYVGNAFFYRVISDQADMPQNNAPLPQTTRDSLNVWISNCAPRN